MKRSWAIIVGLGALVWLGAAYALGVSVSELPQGWRLLAVFSSTIAGLLLQPLPGGAIVLTGLLVAVACGALTMEQALKGYADPTVWLVLAAYFLSRALIQTGLARRLALYFVRLLGRRSLGLGYAIVASDVVLAGMIPSNAARVGGVLLPIVRNLAELYRSQPGPSAALLGTYLMLTLYQGDVMACALFFTGQASNPLAAQQAYQLTAESASGPVVLSYREWLWHASVPALLCLAVIPWWIYRWHGPEIRHTPEAPAFARQELERLGSLRPPEKVLGAVFVTVCGLWIVLGKDYVTLVALGGVVALFLTGVLRWHDALEERSGWDVFIWYGGLVQLGKELHAAGIVRLFAEWSGGLFVGWSWPVTWVALTIIYFYAHYGFASITTHMVSMYPAFAAVLIAGGAPPGLTVASLAFFANFSAGLTHYGTTPGPIVFATGYVSQALWWRTGFALSLFNVAVWLTVGPCWWKITGLW